VEHRLSARKETLGTLLECHHGGAIIKPGGLLETGRQVWPANQGRARTLWKSRSCRCLCWLSALWCWYTWWSCGLS